MATEKNDNTDTKVPPLIPQIYGKIVLSLDNCLLSSEKLERSPSIVDGLDPETEYDLRVLGCELIQTAGILLKVPQVAMATGQVLFQRFYFSKSFVRHPMDVTAMGCIYLASKIEEAPRRVRDVINVFHHIRQVRCQKPITPLILDQQYINLKSDVIKAERRILKELGFCVHVKHPHKLIVCYLQVLMLEKNRAALQMAWNYINDSLRTVVFLQYSPETVACACIYLTARKLKIVLPKNPQWFSLLNVKEEDILDVCRKILRLYERPKIDPEALEMKIEALKKSYEEERGKLRTNNIATSGNNTPNSNTSQHKTPSPPLKIRKITVDLSPKKSPYKSPRKVSEPSPPRKVRDRDRNSRNSPDSHDSSPRKNRDRERDRDRERERDRDRERERDRDRDSRSKKDRDYRSSRRDRDYRSSKKDRRREIWRSPNNSKIRI